MQPVFERVSVQCPTCSYRSIILHNYQGEPAIMFHNCGKIINLSSYPTVPASVKTKPNPELLYRDALAKEIFMLLANDLSRAAYTGNMSTEKFEAISEANAKAAFAQANKFIEQKNLNV